MSFTLKSAALAATLLVATAGGAFASQYAVLDHDVLVRAYHANGSAVINSADEGDYVKILAHWGNWYKIKVDGPDGWVKQSKLDFDYGYDDDDDEIVEITPVEPSFGFGMGVGPGGGVSFGFGVTSY